MDRQSSSIRIIRQPEVDLSLKQLEEHLQKNPGGEKLVSKCQQLYDQVGGCWTPGALLRFHPLKSVTNTHATLLLQESGTELRLGTGWSGRFLEKAETVIGGAYTIGPEIEQLAREASAGSRYLDCYILEQFALALLGQTAAAVNRLIEDIAADWGVGLGPLLSPGSVHGWELGDQSTLCAQLPLAEIGISCRDNGVLHPFNSLSFIIGAGKRYTQPRVGSPCELCSNWDKCIYRDCEYGSGKP